MLTYKEVRKHYINSRVDELLKSCWTPTEGNWSRGAKELACWEFDTFVQEQREEYLLMSTDYVCPAGGSHNFTESIMGSIVCTKCGKCPPGTFEVTC